jgi:hypothetical protein
MGTDHSGPERPGRQRGFLGEMRDAVRRGSAGPAQASAPAGRAERLGLAPPEPAGSQAETLPSRIVHAGHRHRIGSELSGSWHGRPAVVFDLDLATDYGGRGEDTDGAVKGRFHVAAIAVHGTFAWWAMTRPDIREHLPQADRGGRMPGTGRLERVLILADPGGLPVVAPPVIDWAGHEAAGRRIGRHPVSVLEVVGQWALAAVPVAGLEHSDENAAALAARLRRPELGPWPEQLLGLLAEFSSRLEATPR